MKCPQCEHENREGARFCDECGCRLEIVCLKCGKVNRPEAKFCDEFGHNLRKPKEASAIDFQQPRSYTPKFRAYKILTSRSAIEGERKLVTVLFADVAGFTSMSEKLYPESVHQIMDGCFGILMDWSHPYKGTTNQFLLDVVLATIEDRGPQKEHAHQPCPVADTFGQNVSWESTFQDDVHKSRQLH